MYYGLPRLPLRFSLAMTGMRIMTECAQWRSVIAATTKCTGAYYAPLHPIYNFFLLSCPIRSLICNILPGPIQTRQLLFLTIFRWNWSSESFVFWWGRVEQERQRWWNFCLDNSDHRPKWFFSTKKISRGFRVVKFRHIDHVLVSFFKTLNWLIGWR